MEFSTRIRREDARDSYPPGLSRFSSSSSSMAIPMSPSARADNSNSNVPPPLPPPTHPLTDPHRYEPLNRPGYSSSSFGSRYASGSSGYGSLADSMSSSDVCDFRRREVKPMRDEGYSSLSASRRPEPAPAVHQFLTHNSFSFKSYGDSLKDKLDAGRSLDPKPSQPRSALSLDTERTQPPMPQGSRRPILDALPHISLPSRPRLLEEPERFMQTPIHTAVSPGFPGFTVGGGGGGERCQDAMSSDLDRSPRRTRRTGSSSTPEDMTEDGDIEVARLCIDDSRSDYMKTGLKRRASSPAAEEPPPGFFVLPGDPRRREGPRGSRGSPVPRLGAMHQTSFSSVSSAGRSSSYVFSAAGLSAAAPTGFGRRSPVPYSPGGMSPLGPGVDCASPFSAPVSLDPSPRTSISRMVSPHQRSVADPRAMPSPRKLSGVNRTISSGGVQDFYMCECCLKKPKKFDTREELAAHEAEKQYECTFCGNRFKNKNEAERHQNSLHVRPHSWSCSALTSYERAYHESTLKPGQADTCGYCGEEFERHGDFTPMGTREFTQADWDERARHLQEVHKFRECNNSKKFYRADHFRQHLKHSHAGTSGKWTNMLENACMIDEEQPTMN